MLPAGYSAQPYTILRDSFRSIGPLFRRRGPRSMLRRFAVVFRLPEPTFLLWIFNPERASIHLGAVTHRRIRAQEDDVPAFVGEAEHQDFARKARDRLWAEIDDCQHLHAA